jgi:hypothetical protein
LAPELASFKKLPEHIFHQEAMNGMQSALLKSEQVSTIHLSVSLTQKFSFFSFPFVK